MILIGGPLDDKDLAGHLGKYEHLYFQQPWDHVTIWVTPKHGRAMYERRGDKFHFVKFWDDEIDGRR